MFELELRRMQAVTVGSCVPAGKPHRPYCGLCWDGNI